MDMHSSGADPLLMAKKPKPRVETEPDEAPLYVGPWIRACKSTPAEVSRGAAINEGYLSGIIAGKKKNPSRAKLTAIAKFLRITVGDFYRPPPPAKLLDQIADYDPEVIVRLSQQRKSSH